MRLLITIFMISACSLQKNSPAPEPKVEDQSTKPDVEQPQSAETVKNNEPFPSSLELLAENGLTPLESVHSLRLKSDEFRVIAVRAALQDMVDGPTPAVSIQPPEQSDYVQILRCPENLDIVGGPGGEELSQVLLGSAIDQEEIFNRNDFWGAAIESGCKRISKIFSDRIFQDSAAPSGTWVYLVRACVLQRRLNAAEGFSSDGCSPFVNASTPLEFRNERDHRMRVMEEELEALSSEVDHVWAQYTDLLTRSSEAFDRCAKKNFEGATKGNARRKNLSVLVNAVPAAIGLAVGGRRVMNNLKAGQSPTQATGTTSAKTTGANLLKWAGTSLGVGYISFTVLSGAIRDGAEFDSDTCAEAVAMDNEIARLGQLLDHYTLQRIALEDDIKEYRSR